MLLRRLYCNSTRAASASPSSADFMAMERQFGAHNYHPLPVVFSKASGVHVWDPEGRRYYDFLSAYSAVNQGHGHPKILAAFQSQVGNLTLSSRAFYNDQFPKFARYVTQLFGYERVLPSNGGVEAVESSLKTARRWGYRVKGIPAGEAVLVGCESCFHGRSLGAISLSSDPEATTDFGPFVPGVSRVPFGDAAALEAFFRQHGPRVAGFILEPIQGEAGVVVPPAGYLRRVRELCTKYNVLMIADEIQTGLARTGRMLACEWDAVRPDVLLLGKALSGGVYPLSVMLCDSKVMDVITPGSHGSTFGGNPVASAVGVAALQVIVEEKLAEKADKLGEFFRAELLRNSQGVGGKGVLQSVRGKGLLNAIVVPKDFKVSAMEVCKRMMRKGLLAKPTHENIIRLAPPLVITREQLGECAEIIVSTLSEV